MRTKQNTITRLANKDMFSLVHDANDPIATVKIDYHLGVTDTSLWMNEPDARLLQEILNELFRILDSKPKS